MLKQLTKLTSVLALAFIAALALFIAAAWPTIKATAPAVAVILAAVVSLSAVAWLLFFILRGWDQTSTERTENHARRIAAAAEAGLTEARAMAEARKLSAEARKAEREADLQVITAPDGHQIFISDGNPHGRFVAAHLALSGQVNGKPIEADQLQAAAWQYWNAARTTHPAPAALGPGTMPAVSLPDKIDLLTLLPPGGPSIDLITLGVTAGANGIEPVTAPLGKLVHVGVGGSSGWGKSVQLQSMAFQIALSSKPARLALVDLEGQTFSPFQALGADRLAYPIADELPDILAILADLVDELERRREAFKAYPQAADLDEFNALAGPERALPPIALMIDEATVLLDEKGITEALTPLALRARKFGIFAVLGGQNWAAATVPSKIRDQFSTRIQFRAMSKTQSRVMIEDSAAADIAHEGRAWAVMRGRPLFELQAPFVDKATLTAALASVAGGEPPILPELVTVGGQPSPRDLIILEMIDAGASLNQISKEINDGRTGGTYNDEIKATVRRWRNIDL